MYHQRKDTTTLLLLTLLCGVGNDYSAFVVVDITSFPHKVVAKYRDNTIKPMLFPSIIYDVAKSYNECFHSL